MEFEDMRHGGAEITKIIIKTLDDGSEVEVAAGKRGVTEISIVMQNGQMAAVPWARIHRDKSADSLINLANVEEVFFK